MLHSGEKYREETTRVLASIKLISKTLNFFGFLFRPSSYHFSLSHSPHRRASHTTAHSDGQSSSTVRRVIQILTYLRCFSDQKYSTRCRSFTWKLCKEKDTLSGPCGVCVVQVKKGVIFFVGISSMAFGRSLLTDLNYIYMWKWSAIELIIEEKCKFNKTKHKKWMNDCRC